VESLQGAKNEGDTGDGVTVVRGDALRWLEQCEAGSIDIAFVDPPFGKGLEGRALELLVERGCMAPSGLVYLETPRQAAPPMPPGCIVAREKLLGEVRMQLFERAPQAAA